MHCNSDIHNEINEIVCPFCDEKIDEYSVKKDGLCCQNMKMKNNNGQNVCENCGQVYQYDMVIEYIDFHQNIYEFKKINISASISYQ